MTIGELKTHGEDHGEKKDSSDFQEETPVVSATWLHILKNDHQNKIIHLNINRQYIDRSNIPPDDT